MYDVYWLKVADDVTNLGIKIPGIHAHGQKYSNDTWKIIWKQWMKQNMQSIFKQEIVQWTVHMCRYCPTNESQGELKGYFRVFYMQAKGDYMNWIHSDQVVLEIVRRGGLSPLRSDGSHDGQAVRWWPRTLKSNLNLKGNYQARVYSG